MYYKNDFCGYEEIRGDTRRYEEMIGWEKRGAKQQENDEVENKQGRDLLLGQVGK